MWPSAAVMGPEVPSRADGILDLTEVQQLLPSVLKAQGNPVSLDVMPDSSHAYLRGEGWEVFLATSPKTAAQGRTNPTD